MCSTLNVVSLDLHCAVRNPEHILCICWGFFLCICTVASAPDGPTHTKQLYRFVWTVCAAILSWRCCSLHLPPPSSMETRKVAMQGKTSSGHWVHCLSGGPRWTVWSAVFCSAHTTLGFGVCLPASGCVSYECICNRCLCCQLMSLSAENRVCLCARYSSGVCHAVCEFMKWI